MTDPRIVAAWLAAATVLGAQELTISVQETGSSREVRLQEGFEVVAN
jgi:hypothetical protein